MQKEGEDLHHAECSELSRKEERDPDPTHDGKKRRLDDDAEESNVQKKVCAEDIRDQPSTRFCWSYTPECTGSTMDSCGMTYDRNWHEEWAQVVKESMKNDDHVLNVRGRLVKRHMLLEKNLDVRRLEVERGTEQYRALVLSLDDQCPRWELRDFVR